MIFLINKKWNVRIYSLEKYTGIHFTEYIQLEEAEEHVHFQFTTQHTWVGYLLEKNHNNDTDLLSALDGVQVNMNVTRNDFELAVAFLLPVDPYDKHRSENNPRKPQISVITLKGRGHSKTGVDIRWYTKSEYTHLNS